MARAFPGVIRKAGSPGTGSPGSSSAVILSTTVRVVYGEPLPAQGSNPEDGHVVGRQASIVADQGQALPLSLGNQHAIKGILVMRGQV